VDIAALIDAALAGDQRALARVVTLVADAGDGFAAALARLHRLGGGAGVVGITGAPGVGKSTIVSSILSHEGPVGRPIAVVAVDPSSPFSGGAILGDRIRMSEHSGDPSVFIRSLANRGHLGGISSATPAVVTALDGLGFAEIIVETVGVGQAEVEIASASDTTVVAVSPGWGDGIQASKAGLLEIADIFVVNKADRPDTDRAIADLSGMLDIGPSTEWRPPIITTIASEGEGIADLWSAVTDHRSHLASSGEDGERADRRARHALIGALRQHVDASVDAVDGSVIEAIVARTTDPWSAAEAMLSGE
jgi:LAO/AO transport system kinase